MNFDNLKNYFLQKPGTTAEYPFDETTLVFKVMGKMFGLMGEENDPITINLKCDPARAQTLRNTFPAIQPGYHMNKEHWNTIVIDGSLEDDFVFQLIDHSYELVVAKLKTNGSRKIKIFET